MTELATKKFQERRPIGFITRDDLRNESHPTYRDLRDIFMADFSSIGIFQQLGCSSVPSGITTEIKDEKYTYSLHSYI